MYSSDREVFGKRLYKIKDYLLGNNYTEFHAYYMKEYEYRKEEWAPYARIGHFANTTMMVEAFHRSLKYGYLKR